MARMNSPLIRELATNAPQERGISATPVIDRTRGPHGAIYVIANTKDSAGTIDPADSCAGYCDRRGTI